LTIQAKYQTFTKRFYAGILDGLIFVPFYVMEEFFFVSNNIGIVIGKELFNIICWALYVIIGHGKFGQTVGKKLMKIKVYDLDEKKLVGYTRAFFRESIWIVLSISGIIYLYVDNMSFSVLTPEVIEKYDNFLIYTSLGWFVIELVTTLSNPKRRAVHDFIAGSVVINLKAGTG
jgi:uncharacterized RDD family membrane protein YckC